MENLLSIANSTNIPLEANKEFVGSAELNPYPDVMIHVVTDQIGTYYFEFSHNRINWDTSLSFNYDPSRINPPHVLTVGNRYFRVRFVNDSTDQTYLRISTTHGIFGQLTTPINETLAENYDTTVVRPTEYKYEVAMGKRQGRKTWSKWGYNPDIDSGSQEIISHFGGTFNIMTTAETLNIVSTSTNDTLAGTGANQVYIIGIGEDFLVQEEVVNLNGTTPVATDNTWLGINRMNVLSSGSLKANDGIISATSTTFGIQADIPNGNGVTQQAIFHTQINHNFLADWLCINVRKISGGNSPFVTIKGWTYSRVTNTYYEICRFDIDSSVESSFDISPSQPFVLKSKEVLYFTAETDVNNTLVNLRFSGIEERVK